jgi:plastocyanin
MRRTAIILTAVALGFAACGDDDARDTSTGGAESNNPSADSQADVDNSANDSTAAGGEIRIGMKNLKFDPEEQAVKVGQTVTWINNESIPHNVVAEEGADFESDTFGKDGTFEYKPTKAGTIKYVCTLHPGMDGTLSVEV